VKLTIAQACWKMQSNLLMSGIIMTMTDIEIKPLRDIKRDNWRAFKMLLAIDLAIKENGEDALAFIVIGAPSQHPTSRAHKMATLAGWNEYTVYPGVSMINNRRPNRWKSIVVGRRNEKLITEQLEANKINQQEREKFIYRRLK
jgi:hypothetical protein